MKIHALYESAADGFPCGGSHIRITRPFGYLQESLQQASPLSFSYSNALPMEKVDALVFERLWKDGGVSIPEAENLFDSVRARGIPFIYFIDDDLLDLNRYGESGLRPTLSDRLLIGYFLRNANGVVVSTEALKKRFFSFNPRIEVVANALDERLFADRLPEPRRPDGRPLTIGYMGTYTHLDDLMLVLQPLREVLQRHRGRVRFEIVGISRNPELSHWFDGYDFKILEPVGHFHYPDFIAWARQHMLWDIGIAPLVDTPFNRCKSDIKYLDYALLGIPGVFSDLEPYYAGVRHGQTGLLAAASADWVEQLERLITQPDLRRQLAGRAYTEVLATRTLRSHAKDWLTAIHNLLYRNPPQLKKRIGFLRRTVRVDVKGSSSASGRAERHDD